MRFRSPVFLLAVCIVVMAFANMAQGVQWECEQDVGDGLIWHYDVRRPHRSGGYQEVEAEYGPMDANITDMKIDSLSEQDNGAYWVMSGGIGHNYIKLKFRSKKSRGLHYRVCLYGLRLSTLMRAPERLP